MYLFKINNRWSCWFRCLFGEFQGSMKLCKSIGDFQDPKGFRVGEFKGPNTHPIGDSQGHTR